MTCFVYRLFGRFLYVRAAKSTTIYKIFQKNNDIPSATKHLFSLSDSSRPERKEIVTLLNDPTEACPICLQLLATLFADYGFAFVYTLTIYLIKTPFDTFANRADPDQAALIRAA